MADPFYPGNGNLATKQLPPVAPPTYSPFVSQVGGVANAAAGGLASWLQRSNIDLAPAANVAAQYFGGTPQSLQAAMGAYGGTPAATPMMPPRTPTPNYAPAPAAPASQFPGYSDAYTAVGAGPVSFAGYAPGVSAPQSAATRAVNGLAAATGGAPAAPAYNFATMTPADVANAYATPGAPHRALREAFSMSLLNNPREAMAGAYLNQVNKLAAAGINPQALPPGSWEAGYLRSLLEGQFPGIYSTDRMYGAGAPTGTAP